MERRNMKANKNAKVSVMKWFGEIITELLLKWKIIKKNIKSK